ncbi:hypothetical protein [Gelria sp. Kuro-4]|uniref:hypothetical protein n=1 Tax=Gelria sp. Kuro-4 TaxID=2796927 RepID=UPI001BEDF5AD|nr:hypothetical protein [Gelria sp. Kuro-4]BCV23317.1 hypothetical protein kuro4_00900 [Gelria sp. Kuro-4]
MREAVKWPAEQMKTITEKSDCVDKAGKNQGWEVSSCKECDGDLGLIRNTWCLRCEKPISKVLWELIKVKEV